MLITTVSLTKTVPLGPDHNSMKPETQAFCLSVFPFLTPGTVLYYSKNGYAYSSLARPGFFDLFSNVGEVRKSHFHSNSQVRIREMAL